MIAPLTGFSRLLIRCRHVNRHLLGANLERFNDNKNNMSVFAGKVDRFHGITVDSGVENDTEDLFRTKLERSLEKWANEKKRGIWFKVGLEQSVWIPELVNNGFKYHHAQEGYVMMYKWLPTDENCNIPVYAHTMLGVGAVVVNDNNEVLVVSEKYKHFNTAYWKLPGGYVEPGENLVDAAMREVFEETNIRTEFRSILTLRHVHGGPYNCSDIYTIVSLKPLSMEIKTCEREIAEGQWMPVDDYLKHQQVHELNKFFVQKYLDYRDINIKIECTHGMHQLLKKPFTVYHAVPENNSE